MDQRRKFLKNRGNLLKTQKAQPQVENPNTQKNPFFQQPVPTNPSQVTSTPPVSNFPTNTSFPTQKSSLNQMQNLPISQEEIEQLNSSIENVRFTSSRFPTLDQAESLRMPVGCHLRPWFNSGESISMVDFFQLFREKTGNEPDKKFDIPRCSNCRAYVNGFFQFSAYGRQMQCNLCLLVQPVPAYYVAPLNEEGKRIDLNERYTSFSIKFLFTLNYMINLN